MSHISDNLQTELDDWFGRGPGDPDVHGHYPGQQPEQSKCLLCNPALARKTSKPSIYATHNTYRPREFGDNDPASPEQAGW